VGYRSGTTTRFFSAMSDLYHFYGIYSTRKVRSSTLPPD